MSEELRGKEPSRRGSSNGEKRGAGSTRDAVRRAIKPPCSLRREREAMREAMREAEAEAQQEKKKKKGEEQKHEHERIMEGPERTKRERESARGRGE